MKFQVEGFGVLLSLIFVVLKLCNVIDWSWWLVFMPIWLPVLIIISIVALYFLIKKVFF